MKMAMYTIWNTAPIELTVVSSKLSEDITGKPYQAVIKQFKRA